MTMNLALSMLNSVGIIMLGVYLLRTDRTGG